MPAAFAGSLGTTTRRISQEEPVREKREGLNKKRSVDRKLWRNAGKRGYRTEKRQPAGEGGDEGGCASSCSIVKPGKRGVLAFRFLLCNIECRYNPRE